MDIFEPCYEFADAEWIRAMGLYPYFRVLSGSDGPVVKFDGREIVMMGSNNYLGLTHHPEVVEAAKAAIDKYGTACTGSRLLNGNLALHEELEVELAQAFRREATLVYAAGFLANTGAIACLGSSDMVIFSDADNHASLIDGTRLAKSDVRVFHGVASLRAELETRDDWSNALVITEGIFSMTGRIGPLVELAELKRRHGFRLLLDDAHGLGVLGPEGRGTAAFLGVEDDVDVLIGTFSKALASVGGFVAGPAKVIDYLRHKSRSLIFTAALPPASTAAALTALRIMRREPQLFVRAQRNAEHWRRGLEALGFCTLGSKTPIVPVFVGSESLSLHVCKALLELGVFATPVMHPAMPWGQALIRTSTSPMHTIENLERALAAFAALRSRFKLADVDPAHLPRTDGMDYTHFAPPDDRESA